MDRFFFGGGFTALVFLMFGITLCGFLLALIRWLVQWGKNQRAPRLTVEARITAKRMHVTHAHHAGGINGMQTMSSSMTSYYVTFEVESGDRMELRVNGAEYGQLAEGGSRKAALSGNALSGL